jgi:hypothetical protein
MSFGVRLLEDIQFFYISTSDAKRGNASYATRRNSFAGQQVRRTFFHSEQAM